MTSRILFYPMAESEFEGFSPTDVQQKFFAGTLVNRFPKPIFYHNRELGRESGTIVLFQFRSFVIAHATFERRVEFRVNNGAPLRGMELRADSIVLFEPIETRRVKEVLPAIKNIRHPHYLAQVNFGSFEKLLVNRRVAIPSGLLPGEVLDPSALVEGSVSRVEVNSYERSSNARKICLQTHGYRCFVCGLNFQEQYGPIAEGFIHVHHKKEISRRGGAYEVDPVNDLVPVCPNCHAVIHFKAPCFTVEEVKFMIQEAKKNRASAT